MPKSRNHERRERKFEDPLGLTAGLSGKAAPGGGYFAVEGPGGKRVAYVGKPRRKGQWLDHLRVRVPATLLRGLEVKDTAGGQRILVTEKTRDKGRAVLDWLIQAAAGEAPRATAEPAPAIREPAARKRSRSAKKAASD